MFSHQNSKEQITLPLTKLYYLKVQNRSTYMGNPISFQLSQKSWHDSFGDQYFQNKQLALNAAKRDVRAGKPIGKQRSVIARESPSSHYYYQLYQTDVQIYFGYMGTQATHTVCIEFHIPGHFQKESNQQLQFKDHLHVYACREQHVKMLGAIFATKYIRTEQKIKNYNLSVKDHYFCQPFEGPEKRTRYKPRKQNQCKPPPKSAPKRRLTNQDESSLSDKLYKNGCYPI